MATESQRYTKAELLQVIRLVQEGRIKSIVSKTLLTEKTNESLMELSEKGTAGNIVLTASSWRLQSPEHELCKSQGGPPLVPPCFIPLFPSYF